MSILSDELAAGHPDTGAYDADDAIAAAQLNALNRDGDTTIDTLFQFLLLDNTYKTDAGDDTQDRSLWLRIKDVASITPWNTGTQPDPWGGGGTITEIQGIKCRQLYEFFTLALQGSLPLSLAETNFGVYLAGARACGCMSTDHETALKALSQNRRSRGEERGLGVVKPGHVEEARR